MGAAPSVWWRVESPPHPAASAAIAAIVVAVASLMAAR
jgi:hypothetical protein